MRHTQKVIISQPKRTDRALTNPVNGALGAGAFVRLTSNALSEDRIKLCVFCVGGDLLFAVLNVRQR